MAAVAPDKGHPSGTPVAGPTRRHEVEVSADKIIVHHTDFYDFHELEVTERKTGVTSSAWGVVEDGEEV